MSGNTSDLSNMKKIVIYMLPMEGPRPCVSAFKIHIWMKRKRSSYKMSVNKPSRPCNAYIGWILSHRLCQARSNNKINQYDVDSFNQFFDFIFISQL